ncbi:MAG: hypothetical protein LBS70_09070 [Candidatus Accumulibacter sp.]|jgi:tRNA A37 threonylcarbamoyladenosine biosynthesis protein TsaE|nr:hypothetical protein [Accumulibacter sp.]
MSKSEILPVLDPRGVQARPLIKLAPRPTLDQLREGRILFYDNTKLSFCEYSTVFTRIKERFVESGIANFVDYRETVRGKSTEQLHDYAAMLAKEKPTAAVVALGDMGTSAATTIVSMALEKLGIPTLYVTAPPGTNVVKAVAFYRAGRLCISSLDIYQGSSAKEIAAEVDKNWTSMLDALTLPEDRISERAALHFGLDEEAPAADGLIKLAGRFDLSDEDLAQPAAGIEEINDLFNELHVSDGLPIIPPSQVRVERMKAYCPWSPDTVLATQAGPAGKNITVQDLLVAAVMAGCKPQHMPILVTAFKALANPKYNFLQSITTSHPGGNMVLVSGPLADEVGIFGGQGCLGPGFPANATIGRAVNLAIVNVCRSVPGFADLDCISSQAGFTYCFSEDPALSPWATINVERFDAETTTVYVLKAESQHDIIDFLSENGGDLMDTLTDCCTTLGTNNAYMPGPLILVLTPDHAQMLNRDGWTKKRIREHIHTYAFNAPPMVRNRGLVPVRPAGFDKRHPMPVTRSPEDVEIVVAGGRGGHSGVILPWALHSEGIVEPVLLLDGTKPKSIEDFRV